MSTNFYINDKGREGIHIGKRAGSGLYCFSCAQTLCKEGFSGIHSETSEWHDKCPVCDQSECHSVDKKVGVHGSCAWMWAIHPSDAKEVGKLHGVMDEYGRKFTWKEFENLLDDSCPIYRYDMIGKDFC